MVMVEVVVDAASTPLAGPTCRSVLGSCSTTTPPPTIVLPFMHPSNKVVSFAFILSGSSQLLVGPASSLRLLQM